jgi:hypothetical protein
LEERVGSVFRSIAATLVAIYAVVGSLSAQEISTDPRQSARYEQIFSCSLPPTTFTVFRPTASTASDIVVVQRANFSPRFFNASFNSEGTGICRYSTWMFQHETFSGLRTLGCYGEIIPPEGSAGEVIFGSRAGLGNTAFCY